MASQHPMDQTRVRALQTVRVAEGDEPKYAGIGGRWHVPGMPSAVFSCSPERAEALRDGGSVIVLDGSLAEQVPIDEDPSTDHLPLDFVYRSELVNEGFNTLSSLREIPDLTAIKGIGDSKASAIQDALDELD